MSCGGMGCDGVGSGRGKGGLGLEVDQRSPAQPSLAQPSPNQPSPAQPSRHRKCAEMPDAACPHAMEPDESHQASPQLPSAGRPCTIACHGPHGAVHSPPCAPPWAPPCTTRFHPTPTKLPRAPDLVKADAPIIVQVKLLEELAVLQMAEVRQVCLFPACTFPRWGGLLPRPGHACVRHTTP